MRRTRASQGFTFVETTVAMTLLAGILVVAGSVLSATGGLSHRTHADLSASNASSGALERVADVLRNASSATLTGFDADDIATRITFRQIVGSNGTSPILGPETTLEWRADHSGEVVMVRNGVAARVARGVPPGGFVVTRVGLALHIHLETHAAAIGAEESRVKADAYVTLRN